MLKIVMWQYAGGESSGDPPILWQPLSKLLGCTGWTSLVLRFSAVFNNTDA